MTCTYQIWTKLAPLAGAYLKRQLPGILWADSAQECTSIPTQWRRVPDSHQQVFWLTQRRTRQQNNDQTTKVEHDWKIINKTKRNLRSLKEAAWLKINQTEQDTCFLTKIKKWHKTWILIVNRYFPSKWTWLITYRALKRALKKYIFISGSKKPNTSFLLSKAS